MGGHLRNGRHPDLSRLEQKFRLAAPASRSRYFEIARGQFEIPVFGQLPRSELRLGGAFKFAAIQMKRLDTGVWRYRMFEQSLEHAPRHADGAVIFPDRNSELDGPRRLVPICIIGKRKQIHRRRRRDAGEAACLSDPASFVADG